MKKTALTSDRGRILAFIVIVVLLGFVWMAIAAVLQTERSSSQSFDGAQDLVVEIGDGEVKLVPSTGNQFLVKRVDDYVLRTPEVVEQMTDNRLELRATCPGPRLGTCSSSYEISVPSGTRVDVTTESGDVEADDLRDPVRIRTTSGNVDAAQMNAPVSVETESGDVDLAQIVSPTIDVKTDGGDVDVASVNGPDRLGVVTGAGNVKIELPENFGPYRVDATSGRGVATVDLATSPDAARQVTVRSETGSVSVTRSQ